MRKLIWLLVLAFVVTVVSLPVFGQGVAISIRNWSSDPAQCQPKSLNVFFNTATPALKICTATNTWTSVLTSVTGVPVTRTINTTAPLGGGGDLSADRTFTCTTCATGANNLSFFSATSSAQLLGVINDETGSGLLVFATSPVLTTPNIGVATATSVNKVAITAPATSATLTILNGKTFAANNTLTLTGTDGTTWTGPSTSATLARIDATNTFADTQLINSSAAALLQYQRTSGSTSKLWELRADSLETYLYNSTDAVIALLALNNGSLQLAPSGGQISVGTGAVPSGAGAIQAKAGSSTTVYKDGGTIIFSSASTGNTAGTETDIRTTTLTASILANDGDGAAFVASGSFAATASVNKRIIAYFGGTAVFDSGSLAITSASTWRLTSSCDRVSSSSVICSSTLSSSATGALTAVSQETTVTGLTLTNTQVYKITGNATNANDVTAHLWKVSWSSAP